MSLFNKKEQSKPIKPELPTLPEFPDSPENTDIPSYESTLEAIKREVGTDVDIPQRESSRERRIPAVEPTFTQVQVNSERQDDKPVFVKLDNYKEALAQLTELKKRVDEAESLITQLEELKNEENAKLESWKHNIQSIKERLLSVDRDLFEA